MKRILIMLTLGKVSKTIVYFVFSDKMFIHTLSLSKKWNKNKFFFKFQNDETYENDEIYHATHECYVIDVMSGIARYLHFT